MANNPAPAPAVEEAKPKILEKPKVDRSGWSKDVARPGDPLQLTAKLSGFGADTPVDFKISQSTSEGGAPLATLRGHSEVNGLATVEWVYHHDPLKVKDPRLIFEAAAGGSSALSGILTIIDWIELRLEDENGKPIVAKELRVVDAIGNLHLPVTSKEGIARLEAVACGDATFRLAGWQIKGEIRPGDKKFRSGLRHPVVLQEMKFTVVFESPKAGEVYLAGDRVPIKAVVKRVGQPWEGAPDVTANNGAKISGGATGQGAEKVASDMLMILPAKEGEIELSAKFEDATASLKLKCVMPTIREIKFEGETTYPLWDATRSAERAPEVKIDAKGAITDQFPGAFQFGKKIKAKVKLATSEALTHPAPVELALATGALDDAGLPANGIDKMAGQPLTLRLAKDKRDAGVAFPGGEAGVILELESDRPLPNAVRSYDVELTPRVNTKGANGWCVNQESVILWPRALPIVGKVRINAVFGKPKVGDGKDHDAAGDPLKRSEYSPFHVRQAIAWASGAWNLLASGPASIPAKVAANAAHLRWPDDYAWLNGKPKTEHPRPIDGSAKTCTECKGPIDGGVCTKCGKSAVTQSRCATCKSILAGGTDRCPGCNQMPFLRWTGLAYKCTGCAKAVPPLAKGAAAVCPLETKTPARRLVQGACPGCGEFIDERALATGLHNCNEADPTVVTKTDTGKNWGWSVITGSPRGGKPHQWASLIGAALNTLGVKASLLYLRPRLGGGVSTTAHDPITRGAAGFNQLRDWGVPMLAFVGIPVDKSRDEDLKGAKVHEDDLFVIEPTSKKVGSQKDAATPTHERMPPDPTTLVDSRCRNGHEFKTVVRRYLPASFKFTTKTGQVSLASTEVKLEGPTSVLIAVPSTLYGSAVALPVPYGGMLTLHGPGGQKNKQLAAGWKEGNGLVSAKFDLGDLVAGAYKLTIQVYFATKQVVPGGTHKGEASIVLFTTGDGKALTYADAIFEVGDHTKSQLAVKSAGRLVITLIDGMLQQFNKANPKQPHMQSATIEVDVAGQRHTLTRGRPTVLEGLPEGELKLTVNPKPLHPSWRAKLKIETTTAGGKARPCPTCGAQPNWAYKCAKCGKHVAKDAKGAHECGALLDSPLADAIVYACPNCKRTVHDGDAECWACSAKLTARKAEDRFGQPSKGTASGGDKQDDPKAGGDANAGKGGADGETPQPVGAYELNWGARILKAGQVGAARCLVVLRPDHCSFNFDHFQPGIFSLTSFRDPKWDSKAKQLTLTEPASPANGTRYWVFECIDDGTLAVKTPWGPATGKPWVQQDADVPPPNGKYDIAWFTHNRARLEINGSDPESISGSLNIGMFHAGNGVENLEKAAWDDENRTLTFVTQIFQGGGNKRRFTLTFYQGGQRLAGTIYWDYCNQQGPVEGKKL